MNNRIAEDNYTYESNLERKLRNELAAKLRDAEEGRIPAEQLLSNLGLFLDSKSLSRILCMDFLYKKIIDVQGVVMEFGTRWGQNMALFSALRGIYEPFNRHRKIIGFDTFTGFPAVTSKDGNSKMMQSGHLATSEHYAEYLNDLLALHESLAPLNHIRKFDLRKGNSIDELPRYFEEAPETIIALAYFDFDIYEPTRHCLDTIRDRVTKGSVIAFDELNDPDCPGETLALMEVFGLKNIRVKKYQYASRISYFVVE